MGDFVRLGAVFFFFLAANQATARDLSKATRLYVPVGYDDNDEVVVVVEGYTDQTCKKIRGAKVNPTGKTFEIIPQIETHGKCDPLPVPFIIEVVLNQTGPLSAGRYAVQVGKQTTQLLKETLVIEKATEGRADKYPYAPVDDADVGLLSSGRMRAEITGRFQNTCAAIDKILLGTTNQKTYELLPIVKMTEKDPSGHPCRNEERHYTESKDFEEPDPGRYLLHVRTQNGHSINRIFTNIW